MIHVDFGFLFSNSPGNLNFELQTFMLTGEYVEVLGGPRSKLFNKFKALMVKGFMTLREHADEIIAFVEMTMISGVDMGCFVGKERVISALRDRFKLGLTTGECKQFVHKMIEDATDNWRTRWYDKYQQITVGIWQ